MALGFFVKLKSLSVDTKPDAYEKSPWTMWSLFVSKPFASNAS
jgi:hypothetical protein